MNPKNKEFLTVMARMQKMSHNTKQQNGIPHGEFFMLTTIDRCLCDNPDMQNGLGITVSRVSEMVKGSRPATSKMLNNLEEKGYVIRTADKKDRRVVFVRLTDSGKAVLEKSKSEMDFILSKILDKLGEEDTQEYIRITEKLSNIIEETICDSKTKHNPN